MCPLRRIQPDEISARAPLPFAVFDKLGRQLFGEGMVIGSIGYTQLLLGRGLYCNAPTSPTGYARRAPPVGHGN